MFVFPANDKAYRQRKKAFKACSQCKRGRRRCLPSENDARCVSCVELNLKCSLVSTDQHSSFGSSSTLQDINVSQLHKPPEDKASRKRFISRLDPSSDLIMAGANPDRDRVGIWISKNSKGDAAVTSGTDNTNHEDGANGVLSGNAGRSASTNGSTATSTEAASLNRKKITIPPTMDKFLLSHLNNVRAFEFPNTEDRTGLLDIYFRWFHPLLPIVDEELFMKAYNKGDYSVPLLHAILMTACRHCLAIPYLTNTDPRTFAVDCNRKIRALIYAGIETGDMNLSRIYALLSLHCEGPDGFKDGAYNLSCAFHHAHTIGIHLRRSGSDHHDKAADNLWWSLWCLDRISTCLNGGPCNSHPRDVGINNVECPSSETQSRRFQRVCKILDDTIELYRPSGNQTIPETVTKPVLPDDGTPFTAIIRLIHFITIILCYKRSGEITQEVVQLLMNSCLEIYKISESYNNMAPLPVISYAVSLTFTVFVKLYSSHPIAQTAWRQGCKILDEQAKGWYAAEALSSMGKSIFEKLDAELQEKQQNQPVQQQSQHPQEPHQQLLTPDQDEEVSQVLEPLPEVLTDGNFASFVDHTSLFGELDPDLVDYWFPINNEGHL